MTLVSTMLQRKYVLIEWWITGLSLLNLISNTQIIYHIILTFTLPFPSDVCTKTLYAFLISLKHTACPTHLIPFDFTLTNLSYPLHMHSLLLAMYYMTCTLPISLSSEDIAATAGLGHCFLPSNWAPNTEFWNTRLISSSLIGRFVCSWGAFGLGTKMELTYTSTRAGSTGCKGGTLLHICLHE
jgi:hypothetical protein